MKIMGRSAVHTVSSRVTILCAPPLSSEFPCSVITRSISGLIPKQSPFSQSGRYPLTFWYLCFVFVFWIWICFFDRLHLGVYATSLSLDIMTSQISVLLKQDNQEKKETTASVQAKKKQEIPFMLDSTNVTDFSISRSHKQITYSLISYIYSEDVYIPKCCKSLLQLALALIKRYYLYIQSAMDVIPGIIITITYRTS